MRGWSCCSRSAMNESDWHPRGHRFDPQSLIHWVKDLVLLWLWHRPAATAPIRPLAWELPYAEGVAIKKKKEKRKKDCCKDQKKSWLKAVSTRQVQSKGSRNSSYCDYKSLTPSPRQSSLGKCARIRAHLPWNTSLPFFSHFRLSKGNFLSSTGMPFLR